MNIFSYIFPQKIASFKSKFNDEIIVVESFGQKYIEIGGLLQSGKFLERLFTKAIQKFKIHNSLSIVKKVLILGLGGGSVVKVINRFFPEAEIIAYEIDPVMIETGKKYLELEKLKNLEIKVADVFTKNINFGTNYDLIIVDLFQGFKVSSKSENEIFIRKLSQILSKTGALIFNRLYFQTHISEANDFLDKIKKIFHDVEVEKIYCNLLIKIKK